jgi:hypothetical protein
MKEPCYFHENTVILNYSMVYDRTTSEFLNSPAFSRFLDLYLDHLNIRHHELYVWLSSKQSSREALKKEIIVVLKFLMVAETSEIHDSLLAQRENFLQAIEEGYNFWRKLQRVSLLFTHNERGYQLQNFLEADNRENALVLELYRTAEEKVQGSKNKVYRQMQAGTNASLLLQYYDWDAPQGYEGFKSVPFINEAMIRTPLILHPLSNKRTNVFTETDVNPALGFADPDEEWICYPAKIGSLLVFAFFHRNYIFSAVAMANLFELASPQEAMGRRPDAIQIFGVADGRQDTTFYHDVENKIWVGKVSASPEIDYFGYTKKALLTLHNLAMMEKGWLPIHGAMVNLYLKDGRKKGLMFMGDSGAGKSETLEALSHLASDLIDHQETVFDDMGSLHIDENGEIRAQGTEVGAFVRLDDLDKGTAYRDMDRSIFFNPEKSNARVVLPAASYRVVTEDHKVDCFLYANNYTDKRGMHLFASEEEAKPVFIEGKRYALGTTQEKGLSTTFFANPFGPMQKQEVCRPLIDRIFHALFAQHIPVGEIYTCLGLPDKGDHGIDKAAEALMNFALLGKAEESDGRS